MDSTATETVSDLARLHLRLRRRRPWGCSHS